MTEQPDRVFVIADDEMLRHSLRLLLDSAGLIPVVFATAEEFLASSCPDQPGCLILDLQIPGMSAIELQQKLNQRGAKLPVIVLTSYGDVRMVVETMRLGTFDFLQKPVRPQQLLDYVRRALETDRVNRERSLGKAPVTIQRAG